MFWLFLLINHGTPVKRVNLNNFVIKSKIIDLRSVDLEMSSYLLAIQISSKMFLRVDLRIQYMYIMFSRGAFLVSKVLLLFVFFQILLQKMVRGSKKSAIKFTQVEVDVKMHAILVYLVF